MLVLVLTTRKTFKTTDRHNIRQAYINIVSVTCVQCAREEDIRLAVELPKIDPGGLNRHIWSTVIVFYVLKGMWRSNVVLLSSLQYRVVAHCSLLQSLVVRCSLLPTQSYRTLLPLFYNYILSYSSRSLFCLTNSFRVVAHCCLFKYHTQSYRSLHYLSMFTVAVVIPSFLNFL